MDPNSDTKVLAESQQVEAVNAVAVATEASQKALAAQIAAGFEDAINNFFKRGKDEQRFLDLARVPFICKDVAGMRAALEELVKMLNEKYVTKEEMRREISPIRYIVYGACIMILIGFFSVIIITIIPHATVTLP